jgi:hypothetical protein
MIQDFKIRFQCDLFFDFIQAIQIWVDNFFTLDANDMGVGGRSVSIVPVAPIRKPQLENLTKGLN